MLDQHARRCTMRGMTNEPNTEALAAITAAAASATADATDAVEALAAAAHSLNAASPEQATALHATAEQLRVQIDEARAVAGINPPRAD